MTVRPIPTPTQGTTLSTTDVDRNSVLRHECPVCHAPKWVRCAPDCVERGLSDALRACERWVVTRHNSL